MKQTTIRIQEIRLLANDEEVLDEANDILAEKLEELNRRSRYCYTANEIGKEFGLDGADLKSFLADKKVIRKVRGKWQLMRKWCASCRHKEVENDGTRVCQKMHLKVPRDFVCPKWQMSDGLWNAGRN